MLLSQSCCYLVHVQGFNIRRRRLISLRYLRQCLLVIHLYSFLTPSSTIYPKPRAIAYGHMLHPLALESRSSSCRRTHCTSQQRFSSGRETDRHNADRADAAANANETCAQKAHQPITRSKCPMGVWLGTIHKRRQANFSHCGPPPLVIVPFTLSVYREPLKGSSQVL